MTKFLAFILALAACTFSAVPTGRRQADESTFKLTAKDIATGTAWVVAPHTLMTAGHMCEMPGPDATYFATDWNGRSVLAHPFLWEMSDSELADLCLLHTAAPLGRPLHQADDMPDVGTPVHYIGYPLASIRLPMASTRGRTLALPHVTTAPQARPCTQMRASLVSWCNCVRTSGLAASLCRSMRFAVPRRGWGNAKLMGGWKSNKLLSYWYRNYMHPTKAEASLETAVATLGEPYRTQHPFIALSHFADFALLDRKLTIEVDGDSHDRPDQKEKDLLHMIGCRPWAGERCG
jgi:hypothetical protein